MIYDKPISFWNNIFSKEKVTVPTKKEMGIKKLDKALDWLIKDSSSVLDFGCGNGSFLFYSELRGAKKFVGIDLSKAAIALAKKRAKLMKGDYRFIHGDARSLEHAETASFDAVILSNIIDNLTQEDVLYVLHQINRILKKDGKLFLKLNPFIQPEDYETNHITIIKDDLLDDGLLLLNKPSSEWMDILSRWFSIQEEGSVYYEQHETYNRLFLLTKKSREAQ